jgi:protein-tyrosine kinase
MNDMTPRRYSGSLLERAAERFDFAPRPRPIAAPVQPAVAAPAESSLARPAPVLRQRVAIDREALRERGLIVPGAAVTPLAEEWRLVKRQLLATAAKTSSPTVMVCSANPHEGKTTSAINLALSLAAERDLEVLLVDADVIKPDLLPVLGIDGERRGLLDAIADTTLDAERLVLDTDVPNLTLLPAGAPRADSTELLASAAAAKVLARLTQQPRRIIVLDSPPALAASPAGVLASRVGQIMLVVRADRTVESELRQAVAQLDACEHIQLLLNAVSFQPNATRMGSYAGNDEALA